MNNEFNLETLLLSRSCCAGVFVGATALLGYSYWHNASSIVRVGVLKSYCCCLFTYVKYMLLQRRLSKKPPQPAISEGDLLQLMKSLQVKCKEASVCRTVYEICMRIKPAYHVICGTVKRDAHQIRF